LEIVNTSKKKRDSFFRACRYLSPHRRIVFVSIICAIIVGIAFTGGLGTTLPIMQVLINGDTIPDWVNRKIVEKRLGVRFADDVNVARLAKVDPGGQAARKGLRPGQALRLPDDSEQKGASSRLLAALTDAKLTSLRVIVYNGFSDADARSGTPIELSLASLPTHWHPARDLAAKFPADAVWAIAIILAFLVVLAIFGNIVRFFQQYYSEKAAILAIRDIRHQLYDHILHLRLSFFGQRGTSDVTSRLTQDALGLQEGMKAILGYSIQEPIKAAMALGLALFVSWQLTGFIILFAPIMMIIIRKFGKKVRRAAKAALQNSSVMLGQVESSLAGIRVVKSANAEPYERRRFRGITGAFVREQLRIARLDAFNTPVLELLTLIVVCFIVLYASYLVLRTRTLEPTSFFLVMACLMGLGESLRKISKINVMLQKSNAAAARLFEIIDLDTEVPRRENRMTRTRPHRALPEIQRDIRFENVSFTYAGATSPAVQDVDLAVQKGRSIAIVGRNGSGKTTLLALLPRFFDPQEGRILIDGADVREVTLRSLRNQIGIVTQDSVIFPGTIAQNIAYALPGARREDIIEAAKRAFAHDFILEKPQGYDTVLGEHGAQLSGGQKQRLCIARAILRATPILILDEATSQVDAESEHLIQQAIESLMHQRTTFVIAHRFSTIVSADSIVVMDRGQIVGAGSHQELLNTCVTYQQLYERQIVGLPALATAEEGNHR